MVGIEQHKWASGAGHIKLRSDSPRLGLQRPLRIMVAVIHFVGVDILQHVLLYTPFIHLRPLFFCAETLKNTVDGKIPDCSSSAFTFFVCL